MELYSITNSSIASDPAALSSNTMMIVNAVLMLLGTLAVLVLIDQVRQLRRTTDASFDEGVSHEASEATAA